MARRRPCWRALSGFSVAGRWLAPGARLLRQKGERAKGIGPFGPVRERRTSTVLVPVLAAEERREEREGSIFQFSKPQTFDSWIHPSFNTPIFRTHWEGANHHHHHPTHYQRHFGEQSLECCVCDSVIVCVCVCVWWWLSVHSVCDSVCVCVVMVKCV